MPEQIYNSLRDDPERKHSDEFRTKAPSTRFTAFRDMFHGRRIERLLYVGSILLLFCFADLYLTAASLDIAGTQIATIDKLITLLRQNRTQLISRLDAESRAQRAENPEQQRIEETRRTLGLPPEPAGTGDGQTSYALEIDNFASRVAIDNGLDADKFTSLIDASEPPDQIIAHLEAMQRKLQQGSISLWGVLAPRVLAVEYAGTSYELPAQFIAISLLMGLAPLVIAWLGAMYATRERELMSIARFDDYRRTFPHILNFYFVDTGYAQDFQLKGVTRKQIRAYRAGARLLIGLLRTLVILLISAPMLAILYYCGFRLFLAFGGDSMWTSAAAIAAAIVGAIPLIQALALIAQEWSAPASKVFYLYD